MVIVEMLAAVWAHVDRGDPWSELGKKSYASRAPPGHLKLEVAIGSEKRILNFSAQQKQYICRWATYAVFTVGPSKLSNIRMTDISWLLF